MIHEKRADYLNPLPKPKTGAYILSACMGLFLAFVIVGGL